MIPARILTGRGGIALAYQGLLQTADVFYNRAYYDQGEFLKMANLLTSHTTRVVLAMSLSALLGACSWNQHQDLVVIEEAEDARVEGRFSEHDSDSAYTTVVPRDPIGASSIAETAPDRYTVVRGDTLWDISDRFLKEPWFWPTIWDYNPQIENPHLIYPGDQIALEYINGQPTLVIERDGKRVSQSTGREAAGGKAGFAANNSAGLLTERISPRIRVESLDTAVPMIPGDAIQSFLVHPRVVTAKELSRVPYVVGNFDGRLTSAVGHQIYVRGKLNREQPKYGIYRKNKALRDPITNELLGYEVMHVADAKLMHLGDPSTLSITQNSMETIAGDLLLPSSNGSVVHTYVPRLPVIKGEGRIISLVNAISQSGRDQVVVLNLGERSGIQVGDVLAVETRGGSFIDTRGKRNFERVQMPSTRTGVVMVFKTFDKVSYALVMESTLPVRMNDAITGI